MIAYFNKAIDADIDLRLVKPLKALIESSKDGVDVEIKPHKTKRSNEQNRFYWANLTDVCKVLNDAGCRYGKYEIPYSAELIHEINKAVIGEKSTARMSVKEFTEYMEKVFAFWIEKTGGYFVPKETTTSYLEKTGLI